MRILICPDKFRGSMTAEQACEAIAEAAHRALPNAELDPCPLSDGGEGLIASVAWATSGKAVPYQGRDAAGRPVDAPYWRLDPGFPPSLRRAISGIRTADRWATRLSPAARFRYAPFVRADHGRGAIIESARTLGIERIPPPERDPERLSSACLGGAIEGARIAAGSRMIIGLGGSATVDGGIGLVGPLGAAFIDDNDRRLTADPSSLAKARRITMQNGIARKGLPRRITAACDVANPLLGPHGAVRTYAPQKGATPEQVERLEAGLTNWARIVCDAFPHADPDEPGAGAAGGLGFALRAFLNADLRPGIEVVFGLINFHERLKTADLVITGEGRLDAQTAQGKVVAGVARAAAARGIPVIAIVGDTDGPTDQTLARMRDAGAPLTSIERLIDHTDSTESAMTDAQRLAQQAAERALRAWQAR